jgi:hypothetical protein
MASLVDQASPKPSTEGLEFLYGVVMHQARSTETSLSQFLIFKINYSSSIASRSDPNL